MRDRVFGQRFRLRVHPRLARTPRRRQQPAPAQPCNNARRDMMDIDADDSPTLVSATLDYYCPDASVARLLR